MLKLQKKLLSGTGALSVIVATSIMSIASNVYAGEGGVTVTSNPSFYLGADAVYSKTGFKKNYGDNTFAKSAPGINIFVGHMFNDNFGLEVGYEFEKKQKKNGNLNDGLNEGVYFVGQPVPADVVLSFKSEIKQRHPYLGLIGNVNINDNFFAQALAGVSVSNINAKCTYVENQYNQSGNLRFSKTKPIAMVRLSIGYKLTDKFDLRAYTTWRNTSRFKVVAEGLKAMSIKLKDTYNVGLGVVYHIV